MAEAIALTLLSLWILILFPFAVHLWGHRWNQWFGPKE
jgi:hypothetical protein